MVIAFLMGQGYIFLSKRSIHLEYQNVYGKVSKGNQGFGYGYG